MVIDIKFILYIYFYTRSSFEHVHKFDRGVDRFDRHIDRHVIGFDRIHIEVDRYN